MASLNLGRSIRSCGQVRRVSWQRLGRLMAGLQPGTAVATRRYASVDSQEIEAAPEVDIDELIKKFKIADHARPVPVSPSYFGRRTMFHDSFILLQKLYNRHSHLPVSNKAQEERVVWKRLDDYRMSAGEKVTATEYKQCITIARRLHSIHPTVKPAAVTEALKGFVKAQQAFVHRPKVIPINKFGCALGVGRRKTSLARAWVVEGTGEVLVNGKNLAEVFGRVHDRESAVWALKATDRLDKYNVWALVEGGGTTGQAEALTLAVAQGLMGHEPALKAALRRAGCVTRDRRVVERKKHGHVKARKMPAWNKR